MKKVLASVMAAAAFLAGAGTAVGAGDWRAIETLRSPGVKFQQGDYRFNPPGRNHGAFEWRGRLRDADKEDGHNVYMEVRVQGHDWVAYYGKQGKTVFMHHLNWDGAQRYTNHAFVRSCRDKGTLRPDNCSMARHYQIARD
ncbi:hypothetical protein [Streptomyces sp. NPDC096132]|uniref:hypothetical protein n=1 Tax=Streptomyces sp. NPDC096132 TaxID=3366075 RepID=UPI00382FDBC9